MKKYKFIMTAILLCFAVQGMCSDIIYLNRTWNDTNKKVEETTGTIDNCMIFVSDDRVVELPESACKWYVALGNLNIKELKVNGNVNLLLADGARLETNHISLCYGNTLHIYGQSHDSGQLIVNQTKTGYAGIGGSEGDSDGYGAADSMLGELHVHGGTLTVQGGKYGAGIGGGDNGYAGRYFQYGGTVTTTGGDYGAGIGSGDEPYMSPTTVNWESHWGYTCIYGGTLTATGGEDAAGIGGGNEMQGSNVDIWGGDVTAYGNTYAAGIGAGDSPAYGNHCRTYIYGGNVKAYGGDGSGNKFWGIDHGGAGIGSGDGGWHSEQITISGGTVYAKGGRYAPGIGSTSFGTNAGLHITGGDITAIAGTDWDQSINSYNPTIAQGLKTMAGNSGDALTVAPFASNYKECNQHTHSTIKPCTEHSYTYSIVNGQKHRAVCQYCNHTEEQSHAFEGTSDCACGQKYDGSNDVFTITVFTSADGTTFVSQKYSVARNRGLVMPQPALADGLTFMGYLQTSTQPATGIEMADAEFVSLVDAGQTVMPTADATYYARYRYRYIPTWTWTDDGPTAACSISCAANGETQENISISYLAEDVTSRVDPTADADGAAFYHATAAYQHAEGVTYQFTDRYTKVLHATGLVAVTLYDVDSNEKTLERYDGRNANVTLSGRMLYKDDKWNTLCLPFDLTDSNPSNDIAFEGTLLEGATAMGFDHAAFNNGTLELIFAPVYHVEAGEPFLVKWAAGEALANPCFENVTITNTSTKPSGLGNVKAAFVGAYSPQVLAEGNNTVLYLGSGNTLYWPSANITVGSCRAYFLLNGLTVASTSENQGELVRAFVLVFGNGEETSISEERRVKSEESAGAWFDLQGRRLSSVPTASGVYINHGQKVIIKHP